MEPAFVLHSIVPCVAHLYGGNNSELWAMSRQPITCSLL